MAILLLFKLFYGSGVHFTSAPPSKFRASSSGALFYFRSQIINVLIASGLCNNAVFSPKTPKRLFGPYNHPKWPVSFSVFSVFRDEGDLVLLRAILQDYSQRTTQNADFGSRVLENQVQNNLPMLIIIQNRVLFFSPQGQVSVVTK